MFLNDIATLGLSQKFQRLKRTLDKDHGVNLSPYYNLSETEIKQFINDLENKKNIIIFESKFSDQFQNPEYVRASLLVEACRMILREIRPKRTNKKNVKESEKITNETLDFKVDEVTGASVDHVTGDYEAETEEESKERPDLYWRRQQWREDQENEDPTVSVDGEYSILGNAGDGACPICGEESCSCSSYAQNHDTDSDRTPEDEQDVGVYVGVMDPNRFLGSDKKSVMHIQPSTSGDNMDPLTSDGDVLPAQDDGKFDVAKSIENIGLKKIIAVYEDNEEMNTQTIKETVNSLGKLLENSLLQEGELERAELVLAMKDIGQRLQKQLEDAGKIGTEDIMPLSNALRKYFSEDLANSFTQKSEMALQSLVDALQQIKDIFENQSVQLEQRISDEDSGKPVNDMIDDELSTDEIEDEFGDELDDVLGDEFGDDGEEDLDAELGLEIEEPLGRARKENYSVVVDGKSFKLNEGQYKILISAKMLTKKMQRLVEVAQQERTRIVEMSTKPMIVLLADKKVRLTENQVRSLMFARRFYDKTSMIGAKSIRVSPSQYIMLENAKRIMRKLNKGVK